MNLDVAILSASESSPNDCKSARVRVTLSKGPMSRSIKTIAESPRREFRVSKLVQQKTGASLLKNIPALAKSVESTPIKELIHHLNQYKRASGPIMDYALAVGSKETESKALEIIGMIIYLLDKKKINSLPSDPLNNLKDLFHKQIHKKITKNFGGKPDLNLCRVTTAREIAKTLITTKGLFNFGLIPLIKEWLPTLFKSDSGHLQSTLNNLESFYNQVELRDKLTSIPRPVPENEAGREIIRTCLKLKDSQAIHSYHSRRTAYMAILSYPRQDHVANCFALSVAIALFSNSLSNCLDDFREILEYGYLKRKVKGHFVNFPALLKQPLTTINEPLEEDSETLKNDPRISYILEKIGKKLPDCIPKNVTVDQFLSILGEEAREKGQFLWESESKNALITVWSNILASMAEAKDSGIVKTAIVASAYFVLAQKGVPEEERNRFKDEMLSRIYLQYDPSVPPLYRSEEGGAFVLYDKHNNYLRVDNPEKFQRFLASMDVAVSLSQWFLKTEALTQILAVYDQEGSRLVKKDSTITNLKHTPWITRIGNSPTELLKTYITISDEDVFENFVPKTTEDLFFKLIDFSKRQLDSVKGSREGHLSTMIPMRIVGEHAFNLLLTHPSLMKCIMGDPSMILKEMYDAAKNKPLIPLPKETLEKMSAYIISKAPNLKVFVENIPDLSTLNDYYQYLLSELSEETVDRKLFQFLPESMKREIDETAIHFADTNWQINGFDIHLAFAYNPINLKLEIFHAEGKGKLLYPLDMKKQLGKQTWEIFSRPSKLNLRS